MAIKTKELKNMFFKSSSEEIQATSSFFPLVYFRSYNKTSKKEAFWYVFLKVLLNPGIHDTI